MTGEGQTANNNRLDAEYTAGNTQPSVELHIEELVLHGFAPGERSDIGEAVRRGLEKSFTEQGLPDWLTAGGEVTNLNCGSFEASPGSDAESIGLQVALAVYRGLTR